MARCNIYVYFTLPHGYFFFIIRQFVAYVYDLNHVHNLHQQVFDFCSYLNQVPY